MVRPPDACPPQGERGCAGLFAPGLISRCGECVHHESDDPVVRQSYPLGERVEDARGRPAKAVRTAMASSDVLRVTRGVSRSRCLLNGRQLPGDTLVAGSSQTLPRHAHLVPVRRRRGPYPLHDGSWVHSPRHACARGPASGGDPSLVDANTGGSRWPRCLDSRAARSRMTWGSSCAARVLRTPDSSKARPPSEDSRRAAAHGGRQTFSTNVAALASWSPKARSGRPSAFQSATMASCTVNPQDVCGPRANVPGADCITSRLSWSP